jgi:hypothetical protein
MNKYTVETSMTTYFEKVEVEAESVEDAEKKVKESWAGGHLREDRQEFDVDSVESFDDEPEEEEKKDEH